MTEQKQGPPPPEIQSDEKREAEIRKAMTPSVARVLLGSVGNPERFNPDYQEVVPFSEVQTLANASAEQLAYTQANAVSEESRKKFWEGKTKEQQETEWRAGMQPWVEEQIQLDDDKRDHRLAMFKAVSLVEEQEGNYHVTLAAFRQKYFADQKSDIKQFVEDAAGICRKTDGTIDLTLLETRLTAIQDLLITFGEDNHADLMVRDFAKAHGLLSVQASLEQNQHIAVAKHADQAARAVPPEEAEYLRALHAKRQSVQEESPEPSEPPPPNAAQQETPPRQQEIRPGMTVRIDENTFMVGDIQEDTIYGTVYNSQQPPSETSLSSFCNTMDASQPEQPVEQTNPKTKQDSTKKDLDAIFGAIGDVLVEGVKNKTQKNNQRRQEARDLLGAEPPSSVLNLILHHPDIPVAELLPLPGNTVKKEGELYTILDFSLDKKTVTLTGPSTKQTMTTEEFMNRQQAHSGQDMLPKKDATSTAPEKPTDERRQVQELPRLVSINGNQAREYSKKIGLSNLLIYKSPDDFGPGYEMLAGWNEPSVTEIYFKTTDNSYLIQVLNPEERDNTKRKYLLVDINSNKEKGRTNENVEGVPLTHEEIMNVTITTGEKVRFGKNKATGRYKETSGKVRPPITTVDKSKVQTGTEVNFPPSSARQEFIDELNRNQE